MFDFSVRPFAVVSVGFLALLSFPSGAYGVTPDGPTPDEPRIEFEDVGTEVEAENIFDVEIVDLQTAQETPVSGARGLDGEGFLYGERDYPVTHEAVALAAIGIDPSTADAADVLLSEPIPVQDANGESAYVGFNIDAGVEFSGYVLVGTHTRVPLVGPVSTTGYLEADRDYSYFDSVGLLDVDVAGEPTDGVLRLTLDAYDQELSLEREAMLHADRETLNALERENQVALNNLAGILGAEPDTLVSTATYNGQDGSGYGGIVTPTTYLADRYGGTWTTTASKTLSMPSFTMTSIDDKSPSKNHCVPTAITRAFAHARAKGYTKIPSDNQTLFVEVKTVALKKGYSATTGVAWNKIEPMIEAVGDDQGYPKTQSKWIGLWTWTNTIKSSIADAEPMLLSFQSGYYDDHSVTVAGWREYKSSTGRTARMIAIWDGWKSTMRYVDFEAFSMPPNIGAFHTVEVTS